jgi:hypothetical protein
MLRRVLLLAIPLLSSSLQAQTIDDGLMMSKNTLCTGFTYGQDRWTDYWEGTLKRDNQNIGTLTTQTVTWMGNYGITSRLGFIVMLPYVSTKASGGTLHSVKGLQDLTLAAKYQLASTSIRGGNLKAFVVGSYATPVSDYTPDLYPLSLGSASQRAAGRLTLYYQTGGGWFLNASGAYTWRGNVTLDRPAYFTNGQLYLTDQVALPNVLDYSVSVGFRKHGFLVPLTYSQQITRGGGDIRRQDMPFVSNKMNFSKLGVLVTYSPPQAKSLTLRVDGNYTPTGRNVGQSTTVTAGLLYALHF